MTTNTTPLVPGWAALAALALLGVAAVPGCLSNENPHDDEVSSFPLVGRHAAIPCESCHGDGAFGPLDPACESCHEAERPEGHYEGSCGNAGCHIPQGWAASGGVGIGDDDDDDDTTTPGDDDDDDDDTTTPGDDDDDTTTVFDHDFLPLSGPHDVPCTDCHADLVTITERLVCQDCHDADRPSATHYAGQDCAHCHPIQSGFGGYSVHAFDLPHPSASPNPVSNACRTKAAPQAIEECIACHPDPSNRGATATCTNCHLQTGMDCQHQAFGSYSYDDGACLGCHPSGN